MHTDQMDKHTYLEAISFDDPRGSRYEVEVNDEGVTVYSECCASLMSEETARKLHDAIDRWLADRHAG